VAVDGKGHAYVTGTTVSFDFPTYPVNCSSTKPCPYQSKSASIGGVFVAKLNPTGTGFVYSTFLSGTHNWTKEWGSGGSSGNAIAIDSAGNAYVAGETCLKDFPLAGIGKKTKHSGKEWAYDGFVSKLDPNGSKLIYSRYLGGTGSDVIRGIDVDSAGNVYVTGDTNSVDFPTTSGAYDQKCGSTGLCGWDAARKTVPADVFVTKLGKAGSLVYSTYLGGDDMEMAYSITVDSWSRAHITGRVLSYRFPYSPGEGPPCSVYTPGCKPGCTTGPCATPAAFCALPDGFVATFSADGKKLSFATYLGGSKLGDQGDRGTGIVVDGGGNLYVVGETNSKGFPLSPTAYDKQGYGFAMKLPADCNANQVPDPWDIKNKTSKDMDGNGIPDECDGTVSNPWVKKSSAGNSGIWESSLIDPEQHELLYDFFDFSLRVDSMGWSDLIMSAADGVSASRMAVEGAPGTLIHGWIERELLEVTEPGTLGYAAFAGERFLERTTVIAPAEDTVHGALVTLLVGFPVYELAEFGFDELELRRIATPCELDIRRGEIFGDENQCNVMEWQENGQRNLGHAEPTGIPGESGFYIDRNENVVLWREIFVDAASSEAAPRTDRR